jgi:Tol biopolymer transport system component
MRKTDLKFFFFVFVIIGSVSCAMESIGSEAFPHMERWGLYSLQLTNQESELIHGSSTTISNLDLHPDGERLLFSRNVGGESLNNSEIFSINITGGDERRLTDNAYVDTYPVWSPDGDQIAYLSWPDQTLDIYLMDPDGGNQRLLYDSGSYDADID